MIQFFNLGTFFLPFLKCANQLKYTTPSKSIKIHLHKKISHSNHFLSPTYKFVANVGSR